MKQRIHMKAMERIKAWLLASNRWKHIVGGIAVGLGADGTYCAAYAGTGVASALELKDRLHGGRWDWIDWALTLAGVAAGQMSRRAVL